MTSTQSFITINADSTMEANADTTFFGIGALLVSAEAPRTSGSRATRSRAGTAARRTRTACSRSRRTRPKRKATATSEQRNSQARHRQKHDALRAPQRLDEGRRPRAAPRTAPERPLPRTRPTAATATADMVTIGAIAIAFGVAKAEVTSGASTEAGIGGAQVGSDAVTISATSFDTAHASAGGGSGGAITITILQPDARVNGNTRRDQRGLAERDGQRDSGRARDREHREHLGGGRRRRVAAPSVGGTTEVYIGFNATVVLGSGAATLARDADGDRDRRGAAGPGLPHQGRNLAIRSRRRRARSRPASTTART